MRWPQLVAFFGFLCISNSRPVTNALAFLTAATLSLVLSYVIFFVIQHVTSGLLLEPAHVTWVYIFGGCAGLAALLSG